jgi:pimeloyl-ACP methyl ester carboxylesterase
VVILHGLLGSSRNWTTIGRALQEKFDVHAIDLRNHGSSPHAESMRWSELVGDLRAYLEVNKLHKVTLVGHSLGGKVAMRYAAEYPDQVDRLVIVDIAAKAYPPYHDAEFRAMKSIAVNEIGDRKEAEAALTPLVTDWAMRQFLLTNLVRDEATGEFRWQVNLEALHASLPHIRMNSLLGTDRYNGPVLLIRGSRSNFLDDGDADEMRHWLPHLREVIVPKAGHNVHVENRQGFLKVLGEWIDLLK